ncbi:MAG: hypothetical protein QY317_16665 [Candidatus Jettenia caeni]|nr:MAG: hypothetical protein QY317_16665 [Candidatus Jettenia caeni]
MEGKFEEWVVLELMGHRKLAGMVKEQTIGAASFIRIDIPNKDGDFIATQFYNPSAVYCMTPTTREIAIQFANSHKPAPVSRWELPAHVNDTE